MKRHIIISFFLICMNFLFSEGNPNVELHTEMEDVGDGIILFFKDTLFYRKSEAIYYLDNGTLIPIIQDVIDPISKRSIVEKYTSAHYFGKTKTSEKLIYKVFSWENSEFYYGYEILVEHNNVTTVKRDLLFFHDEGTEPIQNGLKRNRFIDIYGNEILFETYYNIKDDISSESLTLTSHDGNLVMNFLDNTNPVVSYAVNDKANRIVLLYEEGNLNDKRKSGLQIFWVTYNGTVNDSRVRLRTEPSLISETLDLLNVGDKVKITDRSEKKEKIDDMDAYWLCVETEDKQTGWIYGWFVDVE